jgi:hypothetical protein
VSPNAVALVLVRFLGLVALLFGVLWFVNLLCAVALSAFSAPAWVTSAVWGHTAQGLLSGPIWFMAGVVLIRWSAPLASFVAKGTERHVG